VNRSYSVSKLPLFLILMVVGNVSCFPLLFAVPKYGLQVSPWGIVESGSAPPCKGIFSHVHISESGASCFAGQKKRRNGLNTAWSRLGMSASETVEADDGEALQQLFLKFCDPEGLMTYRDVGDIPFFANLLDDKDLIPIELKKIWDAAPKFPEINPSAQSKDRIDVDSFMQIYRDVDDLFEADEDVDNVDEEGKQPLSTLSSGENNQEKKGKSKAVSTLASQDDAVLSDDEKELELAFKSICNSAGLISKKELRNWAELDDLVSENLLDEKEFDILWNKASKSPGSTDTLNLNGFFSFNSALDDIFEVEDEVPSPPSIANKEKLMVIGDDLPPGVIFSQLANEDFLVELSDLRRWRELVSILDDGSLLEKELLSIFESAPKAPGTTDKLDEDGFAFLYNTIDNLFEADEDVVEETMVEGDSVGVIFSQLSNENSLVGMSDLKRWKELVSFLEDGDLLQSELQNMFEETPKAPGNTDKLDEDGFTILYNKIDELFEDDEEEDEKNPSAPSRKAELFTQLAKLEIDDTLLSCGLEATEKEQANILEIVTALEAEPINTVLTKAGDIVPIDLVGSWDLLYTSSGMMSYNRGLSGLGGSFPQGRFGGLRQNLLATKYMADVEYIEKIDVTPDINSFNVVVNGDWELKNSVSLLTGSPSTILAVEPDRVRYGPTETRADHWKSVRSMNLLDLSYLDDDLRIMRGNTSTDTLFIFKRVD